jgi:hypothetical protein
VLRLNADNSTAAADEDPRSGKTLEESTTQTMSLKDVSQKN